MDRYDIYKELVDAGVSVESADTLSAKAIDVTKYNFATPHDISMLKHDLVKEFREYRAKTEDLEITIKYSLKWDKFFLKIFALMTFLLYIGVIIVSGKGTSMIGKVDDIVKRLNKEVTIEDNLRNYTLEKSE